MPTKTDLDCWHAWTRSLIEREANLCKTPRTREDFLNDILVLVEEKQPIEGLRLGLVDSRSGGYHIRCSRNFLHRMGEEFHSF